MKEYRVETLEPRKRCNDIRVVEAESKDAAVEAYFHNAETIRYDTGFGPVTRDWKVLNVAVFKPADYPQHPTLEELDG